MFDAFWCTQPGHRGRPGWLSSRPSLSLPLLCVFDAFWCTQPGHRGRPGRFSSRRRAGHREGRVWSREGHTAVPWLRGLRIFHHAESRPSPQEGRVCSPACLNAHLRPWTVQGDRRLSDRVERPARGRGPSARGGRGKMEGVVGGREWDGGRGEEEREESGGRERASKEGRGGGKIGREGGREKRSSIRMALDPIHPSHG